MGDVFGDTRRPGEPITAGAPFGPGPGPMPNDDSDIRVWLEAAYGVMPNRHLRELLEQLDA